MTDFTLLFCKALDLIGQAIASKKTVPHAIFKIRDWFVQEIQDNEWEFVKERVDHLVLRFHERNEVKLTETEVNQLKILHPWFQQKKMECRSDEDV